MMMIPGTAAGGATSHLQLKKELKFESNYSDCLHVCICHLSHLNINTTSRIFYEIGQFIWWDYLVTNGWLQMNKQLKLFTDLTITSFAQFQFLWICLNPVNLQSGSMQNWNWNISSVDWSNHSCASHLPLISIITKAHPTFAGQQGDG